LLHALAREAEFIADVFERPTTLEFGTDTSTKSGSCAIRFLKGAVIGRVSLLEFCSTAHTPPRPTDGRARSERVDEA
jgi:hypothetical protein